MKSWYSALIIAAVGLNVHAALAQSWPAKPIRAFIPFAAGSATDIVPRALFEPLGAALGQPIIVERPGSINYGSAGVGTATHIAAEKLRIAAGFEAVHIAYRGGAEALAGVLGGEIDFYYCPISTALPFIQDGRVLALAASTSTRAPELPSVPTSLDAGYPNSDLTIWYGVFMPGKTPRSIVEKFHATAANVLATPAMQQRLKQLAINPMPMTPSEMDKHVASELIANEKVIKAANIK